MQRTIALVCVLVADFIALRSCFALCQYPGLFPVIMFYYSWLLFVFRSVAFWGVPTRLEQPWLQSS